MKQTYPHFIGETRITYNPHNVLTKISHFSALHLGTLYTGIHTLLAIRKQNFSLLNFIVLIIWQFLRH